MGSGRRSILAAGLVALASHAAAQVASVCPETNVCFKLNIPESTASSGNGDIFFQLSAPDTYEYVALGQGTGMSGSNIFVVYTSGNGNVTLSPRLGAGEREPKFNSDAQVTLLEGSGVSGGKMVANVRCGSASFSASNGNWIYAVRQTGGSKDTTSQSANIDQHDNHAAFRWDYSNAKGGNSVNPLVNTAGSGSGTASGSGGGSGSASATSCAPRPAGAQASGTGTGTGMTRTATSGATGRATSTKSDDDDDGQRTHYGRPTEGSTWPTAHPTGRPWEDNDKREEKREEVNYCDANDSSDAGFTPITTTGDAAKIRKMLIAHGTLAALAFVIFFPFGSIAIRLASFTGVVWFHAAFQLFAYGLYIVAFGLGIHIANEYDLLSESHPIIGIVVFACLFFQPIFGFLHHFAYRKHQSRTAWSHIHLWLGRLAITLGIINGGLGFKLADTMNLSSRSGMIAYGVVAGVVWLAWVAASIIGERRRAQAVTAAPPKYTDSPRETSETHPAQGHYAPK
ncbi:hypothetical protein N0V90_000202 [Kalmusia sp. IMI 367209]|nr:hypothetical protein N0V90_000202 [Kalmusia sp. IMI 367209]